MGFEGTYVGHTFAFRLASDPSVLVDRVTLSPTYVPSCPNRKQNAAMGTGGEKFREIISNGNRNAPKKDNAPIRRKERRQLHLADARIARKKLQALVAAANDTMEISSKSNPSPIFPSWNTTGIASNFKQGPVHTLSNVALHSY